MISKLQICLDFEIELALQAGRFISKDDDIKIKRKISPFFLPPPVYLPFIALLSLWYCVGGSITR